MISILKVTNNYGADTEFYNFSTGNCEKISPDADEVQVSSYMPKDEAALRMYKLYRDKGEDLVSAVKHVYQSIIDDNEEQNC